MCNVSILTYIAGSLLITSYVSIGLAWIPSAVYSSMFGAKVIA